MEGEPHEKNGPIRVEADVMSLRVNKTIHNGDTSFFV